MTFQKKLLSSIISGAFVALTFGCQPSAVTPQQSIVPQTTQTKALVRYSYDAATDTTVALPSISVYEATVTPVIPKNKAEFIQLVTKQGFKLSQSDIAQVTQYTGVNPNGNWTPGPMNDREANKKHHFEKHRADFTPAFNTVEEYYNSAVKFNKRKELGIFYFDVRNSKPNQVSVCRWDEKSKEFSAMRLNGDIATYFPKFDNGYPRFIQVPQDMFATATKK